MIRRLGCYCLAYLLTCALAPDRCLGQVQIAGSGGTPPALQDSFTGVFPDTEVASAFFTAPGAPATLTELQIAAYHYNGIEGDSATFRIYSDVAGGPGVELVSFAAMNLPGISAADPPSTAPILSLAPSAAVVLQSSTKYWLAAATTDVQVNWVHGLNALSQGAIRFTGDTWTVDPDDNGNEPAFALFATAIPEPATASLLATALVGAAWFRTRR